MTKRFPMWVQIGGMFIVTIALLGSIMGYAIYHYINTSNQFDKLVTYTAMRALTVREAEDNFHSGLANLRGFLAYGSSDYEKDTRSNLDESLNDIKKFTQESVSETTRADGVKLVKLLEDYISLVEKLITAKKTGDPQLTQLISEGRVYVKNVEDKFEEISKYQAKVLEDGAKKQSEETSATIFSVIVLSSVFVVFIILTALWYSRNLAARISRVSNELGAISQLNLATPPLKISRNDEIGDMAKSLQKMKESLRATVSKVAGNADSLSAASEELNATMSEQLRVVETISTTINEIAAGSVQNTDSITNVSAALEQMSASSEQISANAVEVTNDTHNAVSQADNGINLLEKVVAQNANISNAILEINNSATSLTKGSSEIQGIVEVIRNIAGQTNLLALNAAIEAARAGEAGRGFSVVAEEVRKLAEESAKATGDIEQIISNMSRDIKESVKTVTLVNNEVKQGKQITDETYKVFTVISGKLKSVQDGISQISKAVEESTRGTQDMVNSSQTIGAVAQETSANTQTVAAAIEQQNASMHEVNSNTESLARMAEELKKIAGSFKVN